MERKFFEINETNARIAHELMSFSDYVAGSKTAAYRAEASKAYDLADKIAEARPEESERACRLATRYSAKMAEYYNRDCAIGTMCPSIMISGAGNFPTKKKERQVAAWERNRQLYENAQKILEKLGGILCGKEIIKSDDARAIEKLEEKLEDAKNRQELMKAANKAARMKNAEVGTEKLKELGFSSREIELIRTPNQYGIIGYMPFELSNNNANIRRIESRIAELKAIKKKGTSSREFEAFRAVENTEIMRFQFIFDGKPEESVRAILKANGFKWAPSKGAWQRQITANGRYAFKRVIKQLQEMPA